MNWLSKLLRERPNDGLGLTAESGVFTVLFVVMGQFWSPSPQARAETAGKGGLRITAEKGVSPVPAN